MAFTAPLVPLCRDILTDGVAEGDSLLARLHRGGETALSGETRIQYSQIWLHRMPSWLACIVKCSAMSQLQSRVSKICVNFDLEIHLSGEIASAIDKLGTMLVIELCCTRYRV